MRITKDGVKVKSGRGRRDIVCYDCRTVTRIPCGIEGHSLASYSGTKGLPSRDDTKAWDKLFRSYWLDRNPPAPPHERAIRALPKGKVRGKIQNKRSRWGF